MHGTTASAYLAMALKARGVERVYALCGGHIMDIWMALVEEGIEIVDVRDERSAVYMAHASAAVSGRLGVALVTAGPGVTNAMTGIANAHMSRIPVLVLSGTPPRPQEHRGALQDMSHTALLASITRMARTSSHVTAIARDLDAAISAAMGFAGEPGPAFLDIPVDVQRERVPAAIVQGEHLQGLAKPRTCPLDEDLDAAAALIAKSSRPLLVSGRGCNGVDIAVLAEFLEQAGAGYLDTGESKGLLPFSHSAHIGAMRGAAMKEADLVITLGRKLDFQLAYGSPAVFPDARWLRISDVAEELVDNRLANTALLGDITISLQALTQRLRQQAQPPSRAWLATMQAKHRERSAGLQARLQQAPADAQGRLNPNRLLAEIAKRLHEDAVVIADGGDFLSLARVALNPKTYLDPGPLGCIGLATPFAIGAAKTAPGRQVVAVTGDGAFGFTAIELDTAVRHQAPIMVVVSNNGSWAIETRDQQDRFNKVAGTELQFADHAGMARAFGMRAWRITNEAELVPALDAAFAALASGEPVLVDVETSPEIASADSKSGLAWVPLYQALQSWDDQEQQWLGVAEPEASAP